MASLLLHKDSQQVATIALKGASEWIVGRSLDSAVVLNHASISRRHARIYEEDGAFYLDDLGSTHGTTVAGQRLERGQPVRLFDGLRVGFGASSYEIEPSNTMAAVMDAARATQRAQQAAAKKQQEEAEMAEAEAEEEDGPTGARSESDAHRHGAALLTSGNANSAAVAAAAAADEAAAAAEEEEMRTSMHLPMQFGSVQMAREASLEAQHANFARGGLVKKGKKKGAIKMGAALGASLGATVGAGAGMAVPSATPTLVAVRERLEKEAALEAAKPKLPPAPKQIGAHAPQRGPAPAEGGDSDDDVAGPALPPGFVVGADDAGDEMGPAPPAGFSGDAEAGPALPPGGLAGPSAVQGGYDPSDLSQQVFDADADARARGADDDDDDDDRLSQLRLPITHQISLRGHGKMVTCLALDRSGGRLATGSSDHDLRLWDFGGMTSELRSFRHVEEPLGGYQLRSIDFSPKGDSIIVAGSSSQPVLLSRDGAKLATLMKGDMYIRDMRNTSGHVAGCTCARWHPTDPNTVTTASEDGTVRLWDVEVAIARGDDATSLSVQSGQRAVMVIKDERGIKTPASSMEWHADGSTLLVGGRDGSLQLWERRTSDYKPVKLAMNATPRTEARADHVKATQVTRGAHAGGSDVTCVRWHRDGTRFASRATDGTLKLWDLRRLESPLAEWAELPCNFAMAGCDFSPDGSLLVTGTSVKKGQGSACLAFVSTHTHERVASVEVDGASVVPLLWHRRINQIISGNADGAAYVMYDPEVSEGGALHCATKAPAKRGAIAYTGALAGGIIQTPHALPLFKDENIDHRKRRRQERNDPLKSRKPEQVTTGPSTGGKLQVGYQQALLATLDGGVSGLTGTKSKIAKFKTEDPREELLKYAKVCEEEPLYVNPAYAASDPKLAKGQHLANEVYSDDEAQE